MTAVAERPRGTSWMSVIGGWIASVGMAALLAPLAAGAVAARGGLPSDISLAVPVVLAVMLAYLVGGYVAGRMAGYATSWHGLMTAFFGLFVVLVAILVGVAAERGYLGDVRIGGLDGTYAWGFGPTTVGDALTFGAIIGFLATIFAGWLGGLLAPSRRYVRAAHAAHTVAPAPVRTVEERTVVREPAARRSSFKLLPSVGRKGGERVERETRLEDDTAVVERRIEEHRR
ncbi:MAG TPA: hypothetical protein VFW12_03895 [Candidatus Limnocylindria bacterium]|nr:hypothetical protein [Candidatus Limnocylindria bacterium]